MANKQQDPTEEVGMQLSISSPGTTLDREQVGGIERDLEKIDRRFRSPEDVVTRVRVTNGKPVQGYDVVLELDYHKRHFMAKANGSDVGRAVREARDDLLRQVTDAGRGGHSSFVKGQ
jgi:ribosome-associated translation inhibitor RaiA